MGSKEDKGRLGATILGGAVSGGAWYGYLIGGLIGTYLFPTKYETPERYTELGLNTSAVGVPIAVVYGTTRVAGNYIWKNKIESTAVKASTGLKGGKKETVGYNYFIDAGIGICRGEAEMSRLWANNELRYFENDSRIVQYKGTDNQTIDPTLAEHVTNSVPYLGLAYNMFDRFPLGQDNATAPTLLHEMNRYPYNEDIAGTTKTARIYNPVFADDTITSAEFTLAVKDSEGKIIVVDKNNVKIFNKDMTELEKTITLSLQSITTLHDIDLVEEAGAQWVNILAGKDTNTLQIIRCKYKTIRDGKGVPLSVKTLAMSGSYHIGSIFHDEYYSYIGFQQKIYRYPWNVYTTPTDEFDLSGSIDGQISGACSKNRIIFVTAQFGGDATLYSFSGYNLAYIDEIATTENSDNTHVCALAGNREVAIASTEEANQTNISIYTYQINGHFDLTAIRTVDLSGFWKTAPASIDLGYISACKDGTILITWDDSGLIGTQNVIMDANPAQILYDLLSNERLLPDSKISLTALQNVSEYCITNKIGMSGAYVTQDTIASVLQTIMTYIHGQVFLNGEGKFDFAVFQNSDTPEGTITQADLVAIEDDGEEGSGFEEGIFTKVDVLLKDRRLIANRVNVKFVDRLNKYRGGEFQIDHFLAQEEDGETIEEDVDYRFFSNPMTAGRQAYRLLKNSQYDTRVFTMLLIPKWLYLEIGMVLTLDIPQQDLDLNIRIVSIDEPPLDVGGGIQITAKLEAPYLNTFEEYDIQTSEATDTALGVPSDVVPVVWEQTSLHNNDVLTLCLTAYRTTDSVQGADIYYSLNGSDYTPIGTLMNLGVVGDVVSAIGTTDRDILVNTDDYEDIFASHTISQQRNLESLCIIGEPTDGEAGLSNLEFMSFREVEVSGSDQLLKNAYRGKYYTIRKPHTTDEIVVHFGIDQFLPVVNYPESNIGATIYIKCVAFNAHDIQSLDEVEAFTYVIQGYTTKATHVAGLQWEVNGEGQRGIRTIRTTGTPNRHAKAIWRDTARNGGISRVSINVWPWDDFIAGDRDNYDILIYNSSGVLVATHEAIGDVFEYGYTEAQNINDFGVFTPHFFLGVRPTNPRGHVGFEGNVEKIEAIIVA